MAVIVNTTVLSNFASAESLHLLHLLWERVHLSDQVFAEIQAGLDQGHSFYRGMEKHIFPFTDQGWLWLTALSSTDEFRLFGQIRGTLHDGEASSIAIANIRHWTFLSDDKAARQTCIRLNVGVTGTIGILLALTKYRHLDIVMADRLLTRMRAAGYYSPIESLNEILSS